MKRTLYISLLLSLAFTATAQINTYVGGKLQGNYSWTREGEDPSWKPGFGAGFSFVYWEYEYWFIRSGLNISHKASATTVLATDPDNPDSGPIKTRIEFSEQALGIPLTIYFRPWEKGPNAILAGGTFEAILVNRFSGSSEEFGEIEQTKGEITMVTKTNFGLEAGFQRQLDRYTYLNITAGFCADLRAPRTFNSFNLTAEIIFGVH